MAKNYGKIGVLAGGPSNEREISLRSGTAVHKALVDAGIDTIFLDVTGDLAELLKQTPIDAAFIALHGRFGEDGTVQRILEEAGIPYTGSGVEASKLALDKIASKAVFMRERIPTPRYTAIRKSDMCDGMSADIVAKIKKLGLPVVVKPQFEGSSIGLTIVHAAHMLDEALAHAFRYGDRVLVEQYIKGRELTVGILDDKPLPVIEIVPKNSVYDYTAKYQDPDTQYLVPAPIDSDTARKAQDIALYAHRALGCRSLSRVDMLFSDEGGLFVLEVNTIPGMTERSLLPKAAQAAGLDFKGLCVKLIEDVFRR